MICPSSGGASEASIEIVSVGLYLHASREVNISLSSVNIRIV